MIALVPATCRRLQQLPQPVESVWEGDRRLLPIALQDPSNSSSQLHECIVWVDGSEGVVRAMEMVPADMGPEALVRVLLKAMESPHTSSQPSRPHKIVVCDREIQFYLRGVLQDLDISIEYRPQLPLIDRLFEQMRSEMTQKNAAVQTPYLEILFKAAKKIWKAEPWNQLAEYQIISLELNQWDIQRFYVSILGMLGEEYGILMYRSLESLKQFRSAVINQTSMENIATAFLHQDCYFVTFDLKEDSPFVDPDEDFSILDELPWSEIEPSFGVIHPLEGLRTTLADEEALAMIAALEALSRFFKSTGDRLDSESFEALTYRYRIALPKGSNGEEKASVSVKAQSLPDVAIELYEMMLLAATDDDDDDWSPPAPLLNDDLIPEGSLCKMDVLPWESWEPIRQGVKFYQAAPEAIAEKGEGLPIIVIQTTKPKAQALIEALQEYEGLDGIGFNQGEDPYTQIKFELGILQTGDGDLHLFDEFEMNSAYRKDRKKWNNLCDQTQGYCGLVIAMGMKGRSRGNPKPKDMLALFETKFLYLQDLDLGILEKLPYL